MTAFQFLIQSRIAELDILLTLFTTAALLCFYLGYHRRKPHFYWSMYLAMALATLIKGIIGIALPATAIFLFLLIKRELPRLREIQIPAGMIIIFTFGAPWYIAEWYLHGEKFTQFVLGFLFLSRFQGVVSGHPGPWYYYFLALILGFAPWSHFIPYSLTRTWKNKLKSPELLSLCFIVPVFIIFSIAKTKLPNYILPLYPLLAISVGKLWDDFLGPDQQKMRKGMLAANLFLAIVVALIIIGFIIAGTTNYAGPYQEEIPKLLLLAAVLVAGSFISIGAFLLQKYKISFYSIPAMVFIITLILTVQTLPAVEKYKGTKELAEKITRVIKKEEGIAAYDVGNRPGVVFYNSRPVLFLNSEKELITFTKNKKGYGFITANEYEKLKKPVKVLDKKGDLVVIY
jgi:4-amino-4-deoxy-L-arabinose transferase-like glycosyltransferase